ncbi:MAG: RDD family protein [Dehalococcoidia bacterium]
MDEPSEFPESESAEDEAGSPAPEPQATAPVVVSTQAVPCPRCQQRNEPDSLYCFNCGLPLQGERGFAGGAAGQRLRIPAFALGQPGGFWYRLAAYFIDGIVLLGALAILGPLLLGVDLITYLEEVAAGELHLFDSVMQIAYFTLAVAIAATTIGKRLFGLYVVNVDGTRVGIGRAALRAFGQILSGALFGVGYLIVAFREDKRGLHDLIAGTVVVRRP